MASSIRPALLPQCTSCMRRVTRLSLDTARPLQQTRNKTKAAKAAEHNVIVKLLHDVPRFGRAGAYIPVNPSLMRNRWFPRRIADYVSVLQQKQLRAQGVEMTRDPTFGVHAALEEVEEEDFGDIQPKPFVRPVEIELLSPERSMELIDTFVPPTIDFARQPIEERAGTERSHGASDAADVLFAAAMAKKPKPVANGIYGSVSTADVAATIKGALAHNDEAARVIFSESDIQFITGHDEEDTSRVKQLGTFKVQIQVPGAAEHITRTVRVKAKEQ